MLINKPSAEVMAAARETLGSFENIQSLMDKSIVDIDSFTIVIKRAIDKINSSEIGERSKEEWLKASDLAIEMLAHYKVAFAETLTFTEDTLMGEGTYSEAFRFYNEYLELKSNIVETYFKDGINES